MKRGLQVPMDFRPRVLTPTVGRGWTDIDYEVGLKVSSLSLIIVWLDFPTPLSKRSVNGVGKSKVDLHPTCLKLWDH